jgi:FMN phosphatase YigB (HAD superfamily)
MEKNTLRNLIFDLGGVLISLDVERTLEGFRSLGITFPEGEEEKKKFFHLLHDFEIGTISSSFFRDEMRKYSKQGFTDEAFDEAWKRMLVDYSPESISFIRHSKGRFRIFLLSNTNEIHVPWFTGKLEEKFGIPSMEALFDGVYYSHLVHMRKPEERIFRHIMNSHHLLPGETLFIDDREDNVRAAKELGLHAYLYTFGEKMEEVINNFIR